MQRNAVAIFTGASKGIGYATAIRLAHDFEGVVLVARQKDELKKTAAAVESAKRRRRSFLDRWAPEHGMNVEEAMTEFPEKVGIAR